jgi:hypothetical protein
MRTRSSRSPLPRSASGLRLIPGHICARTAAHSCHICARTAARPCPRLRQDLCAPPRTFICTGLCPHLRRGLRPTPARNCAKAGAARACVWICFCVSVRTHECACVCVHVRVCTRVFACVCACVSSSVCELARVCWSLRCRRIARRNIPGCMLHDGPLQPVHGATWHAACALWFCAAQHAVNGFSGGGPRSTQTESARVSSRVRLALRVLPAAWSDVAAHVRPARGRASVLAAGGRQRR